MKGKTRNNMKEFSKGKFGEKIRIISAVSSLSKG
jgi:hypothetical protein